MNDDDGDDDDVNNVEKDIVDKGYNSGDHGDCGNKYK